MTEQRRAENALSQAKERLELALGGGNLAEWDYDLATHQVYLGTACCMCEVVPGALRFTGEWGVLGQTAPRPAQRRPAALSGRRRSP